MLMMVYSQKSVPPNISAGSVYIEVNLTSSSLLSINAIIYLGNAPTWSLLPNLYHHGFKLFLKERYFFQTYLCSRDISESVHADFIKIMTRLQAI